MKQTKFTQAMIETVAEINKVRPSSGEEAYRAFNGINYRYNLWLCVGDHYGCIPQEAHDYFHNIWSKQFCDDHLLFADDIKAAVLEKAVGDQGLKVLQKEVLQLGVVLVRNWFAFQILVRRNHFANVFRLWFANNNFGAQIF
ncbi:Conserved_hypothetical protein [Hexamita inflata]|uniref:Uncharacterized protein n=1 Tax=Hexamita inflata TaxID=28002 RepID=A0AA86RS81_9EUKA|nr:Conserved hypothetical protein [Hexamita inflata]